MRPISWLLVSLALLSNSQAADRRTPWASSKIAGTPEPPPPYAIAPAFPRLTFDHPLLIASTPAIPRLFVGEQGGRILSFPVDPKVEKADVVVDLGKRQPKCNALYGMAFHPKFAENGLVFLCYVTSDNAPDGTRVSRFRFDRGTGTIDPKSEQVILTFQGGGHNGGCLEFGNDGFLYISTGDATAPSPPDGLLTGQDVSDLLSSVLRVDVDHPGREKPYSIPRDNPFVALPGARPEVWAYGFRNPWKMTFDRSTGNLWLGDVGWELWEMIHLVKSGGNYGWSATEAHQPVYPDGKKGPTPIRPPVVEHPHSEAASITGGYVYRGKRLPELGRMYIYGDFQSGKVWGFKHENDRVVGHRLLAETPLQLVAFGEDGSGELYILDYERSKTLHKLIPNPAASAAGPAFPRKLSETGLFASIREQSPAPGVIPYEVNSPLWSDGATARRFLAVPGPKTVEPVDKQIWKCPDGTVLARTVAVDGVKVETQVLHREDGSWRPYSYVWNEEQTDATLADAAGLNKVVKARDGSTRTHRVHSRAECTLCHNPWVEQKTTVFGRQSASPLGLTTGQLNRDVRGANQLQTLSELGLFDKPLPSSPGALAKLADPYDTSANLQSRARSYLHVNCSHCHQFNAGGTATIWLTEDLTLDKMNAIGQKPTQGHFNIADARLIRAGDPEGSVLLYRTSKLGGGRMPRIGSNAVDEKGVAMLADWIASLAPKSGEPLGAGSAESLSALRSLEKSEDAQASIKTLLGTTRGAMALLRAIDSGKVPAAVKAEAVARAASHPAVEVRDLFERFIPESRRVARLGDGFDPKVVLNLKGDAARGRELFRSSTAAQCRSCHQLEGSGIPLGPDLAKIGSKYPRADLLREILEPSRTIDPKFATIVVETKAGEVHSGLLAERTEKELVLKDAQNQPRRIPAVDLERLAPQPRSLMPEQLLRDLSAQDAADLLEYLTQLR